MKWTWIHFTFMNVAWMINGLLVGIVLDAPPISSIIAWSMFVSAYIFNLAFMRQSIAEFKGKSQGE